MATSSALLDVRRMAQADRMAIESGISGVELMENAGSAVVREIKKRWPQCPVTVLCGPGNNGGDGFVVARQLAANGWLVRVGLLGARDKLKGEARHHAGLWKGRIEPLSPALLDGAGLIVDALFGAGLARAVDGVAHEVLMAADACGTPIVAIDIPSGVMGDSGEALGAVAAELTVTFFHKKPGHVLLPGRDLCGEIVVADIGIPASVLERLAPDTFENNPALWLDHFPRPHADANKYARGHALVYGGYPMTGAARLAAYAAARAGSGLTTIACLDAAFPVYAAAVESIMVKPLSSTAKFKELLSDKRISALLVGPGAGTGDEIRALALDMLASGLPVVLDADVFTVFKKKAALLAQSISHPCIMTPHEGEFARVFDFLGDKLSRARAAAKLCNAIMVLKGSDTVIVAPGGRAIINSNAPPTLATAGAGDVLSGIATGLVAQGMDAFLAAAAAVWLHGEAAHEFGYGLIAEDITEMLPKVLERLHNPSHGVKA